MDGGLGPALGFGMLSRKGSESLVKLGSQGPRPGPPHGSEPTGAGGGDGACSLCVARCEEGSAWDLCGGRCCPGDTQSESGLRELGPRRATDGGRSTAVLTTWQGGASHRGQRELWSDKQPRLDPCDH